MNDHLAVLAVKALGLDEALDRVNEAAPQRFAPEERPVIELRAALDGEASQKISTIELARIGKVALLTSLLELSVSTRSSMPGAAQSDIRSEATMLTPRCWCMRCSKRRRRLRAVVSSASGHSRVATASRETGARASTT